MLPSPAELTYFIEVAATGNISRAAERLGISQPSLSLAVKRLEESLGVELLIRGKSGVNLTRAGEQFVGKARALLDSWEKLRTDTVRSTTELAGSYSIGCHPSVALYTLPHTLGGIFTSHPGLEIKLVHGLSRQITDNVIGFKTDFGLVINPTEHPDLVIKTLGTDVVTLWTSPKPTTSQMNTLIYDPDLIQTQHIIRQLKRKGKTFQRTITSSNLEVICNLVASGLGVGVLPGRVATRLPAQGLKPIPGKPPRYSDRLAFVYRVDAGHTVAAKTFSKLFTEYFQKTKPAV